MDKRVTDFIEATDEIEWLTAELAQVKENSYALCVKYHNLIAKQEAVVGAADKCKHGCRRCNAIDDRYDNLKKALQEVGDE